LIPLVAATDQPQPVYSPTGDLVGVVDRTAVLLALSQDGAPR